MYVLGIPQGPDLQSRPTKQATFFEVKPRAAPFSAGRDFSRACKEQEVQGLLELKTPYKNGSSFSHE